MGALHRQSLVNQGLQHSLKALFQWAWEARRENLAMTWGMVGWDGLPCQFEPSLLHNLPIQIALWTHLLFHLEIIHQVVVKKWCSTASKIIHHSNREEKRYKYKSWGQIVWFSLSFLGQSNQHWQGWIFVIQGNLLHLRELLKKQPIIICRATWFGFLKVFPTGTVNIIVFLHKFEWTDEIS